MQEGPGEPEPSMSSSILAERVDQIGKSISFGLWEIEELGLDIHGASYWTVRVMVEGWEIFCDGSVVCAATEI
jgi:hypothetical protein